MCVCERTRPCVYTHATKGREREREEREKSRRLPIHRQRRWNLERERESSGSGARQRRTLLHSPSRVKRGEGDGNEAKQICRPVCFARCAPQHLHKRTYTCVRVCVHVCVRARGGVRAGVCVCLCASPAVTRDRGAAPSRLRQPQARIAALPPVSSGPPRQRHDRGVLPRAGAVPGLCLGSSITFKSAAGARGALCAPSPRR